MHRCPNRACPSRGLETLIHWVRRRDGHRGRRRAVRAAALERGAAALDARPLPAHDGAADGARGLRRDLGAKAVEAIQRSKEQPFSPRPLRAQHPEGRLGDGAEPRAPLRLGRPAARRRRQEEIQEVEGIGPDRAEAIAEWFADDENRALVEELRELGPPLRGGRGGAAGRGAAHGQHLRDHRHARALDARGGDGGARGEGREGHELGLEEDDRRDRRRVARARSSTKAQTAGVEILDEAALREARRG